jgi:hypothetical protein
MTMTMRLILWAVAKKRHRHSLSKGLQQSEGKLLAMIFYHAVSPVYGGGLE